MRAKDIWSIPKEAGSQFMANETLPRAAALAFYTTLGLAPMLLMLLAITSFLPEDMQQRLIDRVASLASTSPSAGGSGGGGGISDMLRQLIDQAQQRQQEFSSGTISLIIGVVTLVFSASGVFAQLQAALNKVWDVTVKPGNSLAQWFRKRLISFGMLLGLLFILLVSLLVSAAINMALPGSGPIWDLINLAVSFAIFTAMFGLIFKFLPDVRITWRDVWIGAAITALLFAVGKYGIGIYLGQKSFSSSYGTAGSLIALLVWVYYSSIIVLYGAEVTQAVSRRYGAGIEPDKHAIRRSAAAAPAR